MLIISIPMCDITIIYLKRIFFHEINKISVVKLIYIRGAKICLLGVAINREKYSFPVGKVDSLNLFPLDFEEFLWALDENMLCNEIKNCFISNEALPNALHKKSLDLYKLYLINGGMPKIILEYIQTKSLLNVPDVQNKIINDYIKTT